MPSDTSKKFQTATVRFPRRVYEQARAAVKKTHAASSLNEFFVQAVEKKLQELSEAEIDAAFAQMAADEDYQRDSVAIARGFESSDWEALRATDSGHEHHHAKVRASQTRSR